MSMKVCLLFLSMVAIGHAIKCINTTKVNDDKEKDFKDDSVDCKDDVKMCHSYIISTPLTGNNTMYGCGATPADACTKANARRRRAAAAAVECDLSDRYMKNVPGNTEGKAECLNDDDFTAENVDGAKGKIYCYNGVAWDEKQFMGEGMYDPVAKCVPKSALAEFIKPKDVDLVMDGVYKKANAVKTYLSQKPEIGVTCTNDEIFELKDVAKKLAKDGNEYKYDSIVVTADTTMCQNKKTFGELMPRKKPGKYSTSESAVETEKFKTVGDNKYYTADVFVICEAPYKKDDTKGNTLKLDTASGKYKYDSVDITENTEPCELDTAYVELVARTKPGKYSISNTELDTTGIVSAADSKMYSKAQTLYVFCEAPYKKKAAAKNTVEKNADKYQIDSTNIDGSEEICELDATTYIELKDRNEKGKYSSSNSELDTTGIFTADSKMYSKLDQLYVFCEAPYKKIAAKVNEVKKASTKYQIDSIDITGDEVICEMDPAYFAIPDRTAEGVYSTSSDSIVWAPVESGGKKYSNAAKVYIICGDGYQPLSTGNELTKGSSDYEYDGTAVTATTAVCEMMKCTTDSFPDFDVMIDGDSPTSGFKAAKAIGNAKLDKGTTVYLKCSKSKYIPFVKMNTNLHAYKCDPGDDGAVKVSGERYVECLSNGQYQCITMDDCEKDNCNDAARLQVAFTMLLLVSTYLLW